MICRIVLISVCLAVVATAATLDDAEPSVGQSGGNSDDNSGGQSGGNFGGQSDEDSVSNSGGNSSARIELPKIGEIHGNLSLPLENTEQLTNNDQPKVDKPNNQSNKAKSKGCSLFKCCKKDDTKDTDKKEEGCREYMETEFGAKNIIKINAKEIIKQISKIFYGVPLEFAWSFVSYLVINKAGGLIYNYTGITWRKLWALLPEKFQNLGTTPKTKEIRKVIVQNRDDNYLFIGLLLAVCVLAVNSLLVYVFCHQRGRQRVGRRVGKRRRNTQTTTTNNTNTKTNSKSRKGNV